MPLVGPIIAFSFKLLEPKLGHFQEQTITVFDVQQINVPSLDSRERDRETERQGEREMGGGGEP